MFRQLISFGRLHFCKISPNLMPQLIAKFEQYPKIQNLGKYFITDNIENLFSIIVNSKVQKNQMVEALDKLENICNSEQDEDINMLINIYKQKGMTFASIGNIYEAVVEFEKAIKAIYLLEHPDELSVSQMYKFLADLLVQAGELNKAEKNLKEAENILNNLTEQYSSYVQPALASIYTQQCLILYRSKKAIQARQVLAKALQKWEKVDQKMINQYELTIRMKCMLHILFKQSQTAVLDAQEFLSYLYESKEYKGSKSPKAFLFIRLYYLNIISTYQNTDHNPQREEMIGILRQFKKERGEQKLEELMTMTGILAGEYDI